MKNKERLTGYLQQLIAHINPLQAEPPPPIIQRKEAETLMSHCLKQFVRERLYGNMINYSRQKNSKHESGQSSLLPKIKTGKVTGYASVLDIKEVLNRRQSTMERYKRKNQVDQKWKLNGLSQRRSISVLDKDLQKKERRNQLAIEQRSETKPRQIGKKDNTKDVSVESNKNNERSFISAIQEQNYSNQKQEISNKQAAKRIDQKSKVEKKDCKTKINTQNLNINTEFWQQFCQFSEKNNLNSINTEKQQQKVWSSKSNFCKQAFINYLESNLQVSCLRLLEIYNFFQMNNKIKDRMTIEDYKTALTKMVDSGDRVWAFLAFRYWDRDRNGSISSNDIFQAYKQIDRLKEKISKDKIREKVIGKRVIQDLTQTLTKLNTKLAQLKINGDRDWNQSKKDDNIKNMMEFTYLQQSKICDQKVYYSDLELILGQNAKDVRQNQKHYIIESAEDLGLKFSSCYRYSFLATDHNEVTRQNRQYIENIKESIKMKNKPEEEKCVQDIANTKSITYFLFYKGKYYESMRNNIQKAFGIQRESHKN